MESTSLVTGSIANIAQRDNISLAEAFLSADEIILVDVSYSMNSKDSTGGQSRHAVACSELRRLQRDLPGKLAIFEFSNACMFCPGGVPSHPRGGTDLLGALKYVQGADGTVNFTVISDGYPDPGTDHEIIKLVSQMQSRINTIFAGPVEDEIGRKFMEQLAQAARGKSAFSASASDLSSSFTKLLEAKK